MCLVISVLAINSFVGLAAPKEFNQLLKVEVHSSLNKLEVIPTDDESITCALNGNDLYIFESSVVDNYGEKSRGVIGNEAETVFERDAVVETNISKINLTDEEKANIENEPILRSGSLTRTDQNRDNMGTCTASLKVTYSKPSGRLHLCKATGSATTSTSEGVRAQSSNLSYNAVGDRYINGVWSDKQDSGFSRNYSTPGFSNVQLMAESVSYDVHTAGVSYTVYCSRGVTVTVYMPFY